MSGKQLICVKCHNLKTPSGRCMTCQPQRITAKAGKGKPPKTYNLTAIAPPYLRALQQKNKERSNRVKRSEMLYWSIELLIWVDRMLEQDALGNVTVYQDQLELAKEIKNGLTLLFVQFRKMTANNQVECMGEYPAAVYQMLLDHIKNVNTKVIGRVKVVRERELFKPPSDSEA